MKIEDVEVGTEIIDEYGKVYVIDAKGEAPTEIDGEPDKKWVVIRCPLFTKQVFDLYDYELNDYGETEESADITVSTNDLVNHPQHYTNSEIECIDAIISATSNLNGTQGYLVGNIIKYVWRYKFKNGVEDLKKAKWYLERLIKEVEK